MALKYKGLTPKGTARADMNELARTADPANATYALLRQAQGGAPAVQEASAPVKLSADQVRVPDMTGWPVRRALQKGVDLGVRTQVSGTGLVTRQVPAPGEALDKGATLVLQLEPAS
jgi:hypothetical protein